MTSSKETLNVKNMAKIMSIIVMLLRVPKDGKWSSYYNSVEVLNIVNIINHLAHGNCQGYLRMVIDSEIIIPFATHLLNWNCDIYWNNTAASTNLIIK